VEPRKANPAPPCLQDEALNSCHNHITTDLHLIIMAVLQTVHNSGVRCEEPLLYTVTPCNPAEGTPEKKAAKPKYNFSGEELHFESPPHRGDLAANIALGATLLWLPLTIAAVTRAAFVKYRFTDKRISVITNAPWKSKPRHRDIMCWGGGGHT